MKNAILWKRILNGGLKSNVAGYTREVLEPSILCSPIIVGPPFTGKNFIDKDGSPCVRLPSDFRSPHEYCGLAIPFQSFWVERDFNDGWYFGSLSIAIYHKENDSHNVKSYFLHAPSNAIPRLLIVAEYEIKNGRLHGAPRGFSGDAALRDQSESMRVDLAVLFEVLELLGAKNVSLNPHPQEEKQARRAAKRHGGKPEDYRYHTLVVRRPGAKSDSPAQEMDVMPRHMCRGHFAEYGEEFGKGKLFGKYSGRFYIPPHLKGNPDFGTVEKDYEVRV